MTSHVDSNSQDSERNLNLQEHLFAVAAALLAALVAVWAFVSVSAFVAVAALGLAAVFGELLCVFGLALRVWFLPR